MDHQWLTMTYKLIDEELDVIINGQPMEWKVPFSIDELSDMEIGSPPIVPVEQEQEKAKFSKEESQEEYSTTMTDSEL